ncbi:MAG: class I SAM-dependent methyltransferase [Pseudomarimonas sp.]
MLFLPHGFKNWQSLEHVNSVAHQLGQEWQGQTAFEAMLLQAKSKWLTGYCVGCQVVSRFDYRNVATDAPNWRESLACERCGLINRWRASLHLFQCLQRPEGSVYLTEQTTDLFRRIESSVPKAVGSEFVSPTTPPGHVSDWRGRQLRHEDVTRLSFADASQAAVLSFDVLEHVPDYRAAVREFTRVLMPGGLLLLTAPFSMQLAKTNIRARMHASGQIEHILPPQYHGDPLSSDGVLCFQDFGWDLLDDFRAAGLDDLQVISCCSPAFGYLGAAQPFVVGWRSAKTSGG